MESINENDFKIGVALVRKEPMHPDTGTGNDIAELIAEDIWCNWYDQTLDDSNEQEIVEAIKSIDFSDIKKKIDEVLKGISYYHQDIDVELVP